jgi:hypothetical protein
MLVVQTPQSVQNEACYLLEVSLAMVHLVFHLNWIYETLRTIYLVHILHMGSEFATS